MHTSLYFFAALYLTSVSVLAGFWGQFFVRRLIACLGRASIIVFILSGVIFASALTMGKETSLNWYITVFCISINKVPKILHCFEVQKKKYLYNTTFCIEVSNCNIFLSFRCGWHWEQHSNDKQPWVHGILRLLFQSVIYFILECIALGIENKKG